MLPWKSILIGTLAGLAVFVAGSLVRDRWSDTDERSTSRGEVETRALSSITPQRSVDSELAVSREVVSPPMNAEEVMTEKAEPPVIGETRRDPSDDATSTTAAELAMLDLYQHISTVEKAVECGLVNPSRKPLDMTKRNEFARLLKQAHRTIEAADQVRRDAMWAYVNERTAHALAIPPNTKYSDLTKQLELENPKGVQVFRTTNMYGQDSYLVVNWGDSPTYDATRLRVGEQKMEVLQKLKAFIN